MKQKHIDASRELRLWIGQLISIGTVVILVFPEVRQSIVDKFRRFKESRKTKKMEKRKKHLRVVK